MTHAFYPATHCWSVDPDGRVRAEGVGTTVLVDARVDGDELTLNYGAKR
jgi:hypothetical protein